jgi:hypothetical protein
LPRYLEDMAIVRDAYEKRRDRAGKRRSA